MDALHDIGARTISGEADGEPEEGQRAVAHVLVNRVRSKRWGPHLISVCLWPKQFSCWGDLRDFKRFTSLPVDHPTLCKYSEFIEDAEQGEPDPTKGALYYKVSGLPWPKDWGPIVLPTYTVGKHSFYILQEGLIS